MKTKHDIHGGNLKAIIAEGSTNNIPNIKYDFSVNLNPLGTPEIINDIIIAGDYSWINYPEPFANSAVKNLAKTYKMPKNMLIAGNGATELFGLIIDAFNPLKTTWLAPAYSGYKEVCEKKKVPAEAIFSLNDDLGDMIFIGYPNNPTGNLLKKDTLNNLIKTNKDTIFVIDESFMDFVENPPSFISKEMPKNVIVVKSLTKVFSIAGLRLGIAFANSLNMKKIKNTQLPWSVNAIAQSVALKLYLDKHFLIETRYKTALLREELYNELSSIKGLNLLPSLTNFIFFTSKNLNLQNELLKHGIFIRSCKNIDGLDKGSYRVAVKDKKANKALVNALKNNSKLENKQKTPAIMVVGTTSNSGKSLITAALCRYFYRKGIKVAPYKAQNMALNSFVTKEGGEMGRAQVVQSNAANIEPHTDMNPVLLKPLGDKGSQLIVNGKAQENVTAKDYYEKKTNLRFLAQDAYERLAKKFDLIIMEGAGSPTEINLLKHDFVNMPAAEYANAKTILVADIDRGGVFASIFGTIMLLPEKYKKLFSGIIINKFRGDASLLKSGIERIERLTRIPVLGVMPYIHNLQIEEEDSLGLENKTNKISKNKDLIDVAVIKLPRMSNYTDFLPLEVSENVNLRYVSNPKELKQTDLIIIPGTKTTIKDMLFLRTSGFEIKIKLASEKGIPIIGICGGYQILGEKIEDPNKVEGELTQIKGLGLLPIKTILQKEKELAQVAGETTLPFPFKNTQKTYKFTGYEIHSGETYNKGTSKPLIIELRNSEKVNEEVGAVKNNIFGCYIHGLFEKCELRTALLNYLGGKKGLKAIKDQINDDPFDLLADVLEKHIDLSQI